MQSVELHHLIPCTWRVMPAGNGLRLVAPHASHATDLLRGAKQSLKSVATRLGVDLWICSDDQAEPIERIEGSRHSPLSNYGPSKIAPNATYEAALDFIKGKKVEGLIVTITAMVSDKCLLVNDLQALDRGGNWTAQDWIGIDFKTLWRDSFQIGRCNYYGDLVRGIERDRQITEFLYEIRRPSGALAAYSSNYFYLENFLQGPVRVAVSRPGDWQIIEDGHLEASQN
uniref:hypothetical protein n=1 Tax=Trichocoleus desertorum TaxID=1481672 RepID=UPI0025B3DBDF|nr:hypothetical protein [Trichocoleus desertorum]